MGACGGSVSPWNTHLGGEENGVPDARGFEGWRSDSDIKDKWGDFMKGRNGRCVVPIHAGSWKSPSLSTCAH